MSRCNKFNTENCEVYICTYHTLDSLMRAKQVIHYCMEHHQHVQCLKSIQGKNNGKNRTTILHNLSIEITPWKHVEHFCIIYSGKIFRWENFSLQ